MSEQTSNELKQQHDSAHAAAVEYWSRCEEYARGFGIFTIYEGPTFAENELAENARSLIAEIDRRNCSGLQGPEDRKAWREQFLLALKGELERRGNARQFFGLLASQCREILKEVAKGWASPRPAGGECWNSGHCGEIAFTNQGQCGWVF